MSSIITFFVAPDAVVAAGVVSGGPGPEFQAAEYGNFAVWEAIEEWESILLDRDLAAVEGADAVSGDDSPLVLAIPPALTAALAGADDAVLGSAATRWVRQPPARWRRRPPRRPKAGSTAGSRRAAALPGTAGPR
ncbi:hypothetical protein SAMN05421812_106272 [Asanoa hainanensis]|uniref:Uncharacterized protein n=1 Tax=Asanoa hainanensis TaxID=560556 RepID=A0A239MTR2_9ACTN|nr:hypothetical protein [Asanoa hainanensis]SNT45643.1 hypothetical protein SAMN05421812_106272 [Asanoa hainanensis]